MRTGTYLVVRTLGRSEHLDSLHLSAPDTHVRAPSAEVEVGVDQSSTGET
jgi:hypothetical protein